MAKPGWRGGCADLLAACERLTGWAAASAGRTQNEKPRAKGGYRGKSGGAAIVAITRRKADDDDTRWARWTTREGRWLGSARPRTDEVVIGWPTWIPPDMAPPCSGAIWALRRNLAYLGSIASKRRKIVAEDALWLALSPLAIRMSCCRGYSSARCRRCPSRRRRSCTSPTRRSVDGNLRQL